MKGNLALIVLLATTGLTVAACAGTGVQHDSAATLSHPASAGSSSYPASAGSSSHPASAASSPVLAWPTGPVTVVHHPSVPPVPVVTGIRYATHQQDGYDRIVLDIPGTLPGYSAKYVSEVRQDPSGKPVTVPGAQHLLIVLTPAQAHRDDGSSTVTGVHPVNLPAIKSYAVVGDYEGYVSIALGVNAKTGYRIGELSDRIYIDVATGKA
jgi:hypothetical protein